MKRFAIVLLALALSCAASAQVVVSVNGSFLRSGAALWTPNTDLNEMQMEVWDASTLANGAVASFASTGASPLTMTQATGGNQPVMTSAGLTFTGTQSMIIPQLIDPWRYADSIILVMQANITGASSGSGSFLLANGNAYRAPAVLYTQGSPNLIKVQWGVTSGATCTITMNWPDDTNLHVIVSRRYQGVAYASIDSGTEVSTGTNCVMGRSSGTGILGDIRNPSIDWTLNYLSIQQEQMTADMAQRAAAYEMWKIGRQASIPGGNPWTASAPTTSPFVNTYGINTTAQFNAVQTTAYWTAAAGASPGLKSNYPNSTAPLFSGKTAVQTWNFTSLSILGGEAAPAGGTAQFFCPVLDQVGDAIIVDPSVNVPAVYSTNGSTVTSTVQESGSTWYGGNCISTNLGGLGYTFNPAVTPTAIKTLFSLGACTSAPDAGFYVDAAPIYIYPVYWFWNATTPREEMDAIETYPGENGGANVHVTEHYHPAVVPGYGGRNSAELSKGKDFALDVAHSFPGGPVSLCDTSVHEYDFYRDTSVTVVGVDGNELGRWPTQAFMLNPSSIVTGLTLYSTTGVTGTYPMNIQSITVYQ
jgi:hypothetical protein